MIAHNTFTSSNVLIASYSASSVYNSNSFTWTPANPLFIGNTMFEANVIITDAKGLQVNSIYYSFNYLQSVSCINNTPKILSGYIMQNTNGSQLEIFTDSASNLAGFFGPTQSVFEVVNSITATNASTTMVVPAKFYAEYIYTGTPVFHCIWLSSGGPGSSAMPSVGMDKYAPAALFLFCLGIILFLVALLNIMRVVPISSGTFIGAVLNFTIAFAAVICLVFSGFYVGSVSSPSYTITSPSGVTTVGAVTASSLRLASNPLMLAIIVMFSIASGAMGGLGVYYFMFALRERGKKKREEERSR